MTGVGQCCPLVHGPHCPASAVTQTTTQQGPTQGQGAQTVHLARQHAVHKFASINYPSRQCFSQSIWKLCVAFQMDYHEIIKSYELIKKNICAFPSKRKFAYFDETRSLAGDLPSHSRRHSYVCCLLSLFYNINVLSSPNPCMANKCYSSDCFLSWSYFFLFTRVIYLVSDLKEHTFK